MKRIGTDLHTKVHNWIDTVGFRLNAADRKNDTTFRHYFFETFNLIEKLKDNAPQNAKFMCFDAYGEKIRVRSLLDLQAAFFENISQLK